MVIIHNDYDEHGMFLNANYTKSGILLSDMPKSFVPSSFYLMWKYDLCADLIERYEARHSIKFDSILLTRLDGWWPERSQVIKTEEMKIHGRVYNWRCGYGIIFFIQGGMDHVYFGGRGYIYIKFRRYDDFDANVVKY